MPTASKKASTSRAVKKAEMELLVNRLIELGHLTIVNPNQHRKEFQVDDKTWDQVKKFALEQINGREWEYEEVEEVEKAE